MPSLRGKRSQNLLGLCRKRAPHTNMLLPTTDRQPLRLKRIGGGSLGNGGTAEGSKGMRDNESALPSGLRNKVRAKACISCKSVLPNVHLPVTDLEVFLRADSDPGGL